tara:strand:- start:672 stop:884 length:213 start_codon:yes stop_codon:yes gene_type:complete
MNTHFKRWIKESAFRMEGEFTSHHVLNDVVTHYGTSPYIGTVSAVGWVLTRLQGVTKLREGVYVVRNYEN